MGLLVTWVFSVIEGKLVEVFELCSIGDVFFQKRKLGFQLVDRITAGKNIENYLTPQSTVGI